METAIICLKLYLRLIFISVKQIYKYHKLSVQKDYFCSGMFMFKLKNFSNQMSRWFFKYKKDIETITSGGDQTHLNYEVFKQKKVNILEYKFQSLWIYEIVNKYPFLYNNSILNKILKFCVEKSLFENYFLHFAGSWHESNMWKINNLLSKDSIKILKNFLEYLKIKPRAHSVGKIVPKNG